MRNPTLALASLLALVAATPVIDAANGHVSVLTTTTDLGDIARAVGGPDVSVQSLCRGPEDPHFLDARPTFIHAAHTADLLIVNGLGFESGYVPLLLRDGVNARIQLGSAGYLDASLRIKKLGVRPGATRAMGDVHPDGNPHYLLDPANAGIVAADVARALSAIRPASAKAFAERAEAFRTRIADLLLGVAPPDGKGQRTGGYLDRFKPFRGAGVVGYHENVEYLAARVELEVVGALEPKPGVPPTASHIATLAQRGRGGGVRLVVHTVFQPTGPVQSFASQAGARVVLLAHQPGATPDAPDLMTMYRRNFDALLAALGTTSPR